MGLFAPGDLRASRVELAASLDASKDLFAVYRNIGWCLDADSNLIALDTEDGDLDVIADIQNFIHSARQDQHRNLHIQNKKARP